MGFILDGILKKDLIDSPQTVNTDFTTDRIDIDNREEGFAVQVDYDNGDGSVDMDLVYELSADGITFIPVTDEAQTIVDDSGTHLWDFAGTGASYLRVSVTVRSGSIDLQSIRYSGKRRH